MRFLAALTLLLLAGCSSLDERWASAEFAEISYPALYGALLTTVEGQGYGVPGADAQTAAIESDWVYGTSRRVVRGPSRRRVHALIEIVGDRHYIVRLRVEEHVVPKGGMLATNVRESENWEPFEDNYDDAEFLMAKLAALLAAHRARVVEP